MKLDHRTIAVGIIVLAAATGGAYTLGRQQSSAATAPAPGTVHAASTTPAGSAASDGQAREGKVSVDPSRRFTHFRVGNKNVKSIFMDDKLVWVGTSGGVVRYDTRDDSYKLFDVKSGLLSNGVFWVGRVKGKLGVGTYGGGLSLLDENTGQWENYNIPEGLGDAFVYDVVETVNGDIWIATWSGVNRVRGGDLKDRSKWDLYTVENTRGGLPNDWVYGLSEGRNGDMWLATEGGLALFRNGSFENWTHARGLGAPYEKVKDAIDFKSDPGKASVHHAKQKEEMGLQDVSVAYNPNYIVAIEVDRDGVVWVGTWGGGLGRFDGKTWINYTTAEGLPGNHVFMLHIDRHGVLWIGTNKGITRRHGDSFTPPMTVADGLFADNVFSMATSEAGDLWIGSFGGVAHLRPIKD